MSGLYGTLNLGARALQTQSKGLSVAGQNLANVNNPAYSRQRLVVQTVSAAPDSLGFEGSGVSAVAVQRLHDTLLDRQIQSEASAGGFWTAQQSALRSAQLALGEALGGSSASGSITGSSSLAGDLASLFNEFQDLAAAPASIPQRATLLSRAAGLADEFHRADARLDAVDDNLNRSLESDVAGANELLAEIGRLNDQIRRAEAGASASANDLRDRRQEKVESLARLASVDISEDADGQLTLAAGGELLLSGRTVVATLATRDPGDGRLQIQTSTGTALALTGGSIQGTLDVRDGSLAKIRTELDSLAAALVTEVNDLHRGGYNLEGGTGADFFLGSDASDIQVNPALAANPTLLQASGNPAAAGDNQTALALARLADRPLAALGQQTFSGAYASTIAAAGEALAHANTQVEDQQLVDSLLLNERNATSGVSIDEEMADLVKYQKAFQASARIVSVVDQMLDELLQMKR